MSPSASDVSVVTVNWNGLEHLEHLLPSLGPLGCREVVVVDNGSSDGSLEFLERHHPRVQVIANRENEGFANPCNQGARVATGKVVAFINNDTRADRAWLSNALPLLSSDQPCVASRILDWTGERIDYNGSSLQYLGYAVQKDIGAVVEGVTAGRQVLFPCGGAMLIDREFFLEIGGFDETFFAIYEDVDLGWRIWLRGKQVGYAADSIVYHRGHSTFKGQEQHRTRYLMHRNALLTVIKNYEEETLERVFPAALLLAIRRAILFSGVDRDSFYLWKETRAGLTRQDPMVTSRVLDAINQLVAIDDVISDLPRILEERKKVQQHRERSESDILGLFEDPFRHIVQDPTYQSQEAEIISRLGLERIFGQEYSRPRSALADRLEERLTEVKQEISRLSYWGHKMLDHPAPPPRTPGLRDFVTTWKREGMAVAWQRLRELVDRGL